MYWCILIILIILYYILYNKENICVREDGKSHYQEGNILISKDGENDPCRELANSSAEECISVDSNDAQCAFYDKPNVRLPEFSTEADGDNLSDYICERINSQSDEQIDCQQFNNLSDLYNDEQLIRNNGLIEIPHEHLIFSSCAILNNTRSKSRNEQDGHGVSLLEEIGYECESGSDSTPEELANKKRNCSIYNWCLYELTDSNYFLMDGVCHNNKLKIIIVFV